MFQQIHYLLLTCFIQQLDDGAAVVIAIGSQHLSLLTITEFKPANRWGRGKWTAAMREQHSHRVFPVLLRK